MKPEFKSRVLQIVLWLLTIVVFSYSLSFFLDRGINVVVSILLAISVTLLCHLLGGLLVFVGWRIFTPEGREAEKEAQARYYIKKLDRKRSREWRRLND